MGMSDGRSVTPIVKIYSQVGNNLPCLCQAHDKNMTEKKEQKQTRSKIIKQLDTLKQRLIKIESDIEEIKEKKGN